MVNGRLRKPLKLVVAGLGCVTGATHGAGGKAIEFAWEGNDEMDEAGADGWAETQSDGSIKEQIFFHARDEADFIARLEDFFNNSLSPLFVEFHCKRLDGGLTGRA
jgi:hypothetical protein